MRKAFLIFFLFLIAGSAIAQDVIKINALNPEVEYDNIHVKKIDTDQHSTTFVIWIKKGVKEHKHEKHAEVIHVIEGFGVMRINNKAFDVKPGDYFRIPENTYHSLKVLSNNPMKVLSIQAPEFHGKDRIFK